MTTRNEFIKYLQSLPENTKIFVVRREKKARIDVDICFGNVVFFKATQDLPVPELYLGRTYIENLTEVEADRIKAAQDKFQAEEQVEIDAEKAIQDKLDERTKQKADEETEAAQVGKVAEQEAADKELQAKKRKKLVSH